MRTGNIVTGTVLDCNRKHLEKALRDYDKQLYVKWNPYKTMREDGTCEILPPKGPKFRGFGLGVWEVRRRPDLKTAVPRWEVGNSIIFELDYLENDLVCHIMDVPALNYDILTKIKEMDTWQVKDWVSDLEYREEQAKEKAMADNKAELRYQIKHHKRAFSDLHELIRSGHNITDLLAGEW